MSCRCCPQCDCGAGGTSELASLVQLVIIAALLWLGAAAIEDDRSSPPGDQGISTNQQR